MAEPICMKLGIYVMAPDPISEAYFINPSPQSLCLYVHPHNVARQRLGKNVTAVTDIHNNREIVGHVVFYAVLVISRERRRLIFPELFVYTSEISINTLSNSTAVVYHQFG
jgi:hypothetical protein